MAEVAVTTDGGTQASSDCHGSARYGSLYKRARRLARLISELELARLAREPKHKNPIDRDYNRKLEKNTSYAYLKWNKQNTYEF
jgi:hypothetical protein